MLIFDTELPQGLVDFRDKLEYLSHSWGKDQDVMPLRSFNGDPSQSLTYRKSIIRSRSGEKMYTPFGRKRLELDQSRGRGRKVGGETFHVRSG